MSNSTGAFKPTAANARTPLLPELFEATPLFILATAAKAALQPAQR